MNSKTNSLCCFPIWQKQPRKDVKDEYMSTASSQNGDADSGTGNPSLGCSGVDVSNEKGEQLHELNGGALSDATEDTGVHDLDLDPESTRKENHTRLRFSPSTESLNKHKSDQRISEDGQRNSTLSYVSSGYGSVKDTANGFLSSEINSAPPLYEEQNDSALGSESIQTSTFEKTDEVHASQRRNMVANAANKFSHAHLQMTKENNVLNITSRIDDVLEKNNIKHDDRPKVLIQLPNLSVRFLTSKGGKIAIPGTRVYLYVPPGALAEADEPRLVYVYLKPPSCDTEFENNRRLLTPTVECGPPGLTFQKDVFLTIPHYAVNPDEWEFEAHQTKGHDPDEPMNTLQDAIIVSEYEVTMLLDHFCSHCCSGKPTSDTADQRKWMKAGVSLHGIEKHNMQMRVRLYDIDNVLHESIATESFPITESSSKALVVLKGLDDHWKLDEDPIKEVPAEVLWSRCQTDKEVSFTFQPKSTEQVVEESTVVSCTLDVFQHNNNHPGTSLTLRKKTLSTEDAAGQLHEHHDEAEDIQIRFLLEQDDFAPTTYTGLSNQGFREICMHLENADDCNRGWKALAEEIGFIQYQYIRCLEKRALARNRSPAGMVLDLFFKDSDPGIESLKRLSTCLYKIDSFAAKLIVDREIQAMGEASLHTNVSAANSNGDSNLYASNGSCFQLSGTLLESSIAQSKLNTDLLSKKRSIRPNLLRRKWSSIQLKVGKLKRGFYEKDEDQQEHHEHSNQAFEDEEQEKTTEVSSEVTKEGPTEELSILRISITPCDLQETDCDHLQTRHDLRDVVIGEENSLCGDLHAQDLSRLQARPDSGISSLSGGSNRYSDYSSQSVHELTVSNFSEEVF